MDDRAAIVDTGNVGRRQHLDHIGQGTQRSQIQRQQAAARHRRQAQGAMQGAGHLGQIVNVRGFARHMQSRRFVRPADANALALLQSLGFFSQIDAGGLVLAIRRKGLGVLQQWVRNGLVHFKLLAPMRVPRGAA